MPADIAATPIRIVSPPGAPTRLAHDWPVNARDGMALQHELATYLHSEDNFGAVETLGGMDIGFEDGGRTTRAAAVLLDAGTLAVRETHVARIPTRMPYIPGLLSFREVPAALQALDELSTRPDLLMVDGHGNAHPRRVGVASHLGLVTGLVTIGVAKSRLVGTHAAVPDERGAWVPLTDNGETIGAVVRSRAGVKPLFVSPGYRIGLASSVHWVMQAVTRYKLPETTREADALASRRRQKRRRSSQA